MGAVSHGGTDARGFDKEFTRWTVPNVETLSGDKTITSVDARIQLLNPGGASRVVTLDASLHVTGTVIEIRAVNTGDTLIVRNSSAATLAILDYWKVFRAVYANSTWNIIRYDHVASLGDDRSTLYLGYRSGVVNTILSWGGGHRAYIDATGFGIGASPSSLFHVTASGNANALRVDNTTGNASFRMAPSSTYTLAIDGTISFHAAAGETVLGTGYEKVLFRSAGGGNANKSYAGVVFTSYDKPTPGARWVADGGSIQLASEYCDVVGDVVRRESLTFGTIRTGGDQDQCYWYINSGTLGGNWAKAYIYPGNGGAVVLQPVGNGSVGIGASPSSLFHVTASGNANALRVDNTTGQVLVGASAAITSASAVFGSATGAIVLNRWTTTERDALTATKGMMGYNTTTDKAQIYNGAWVDLH